MNDHARSIVDPNMITENSVGADNISKQLIGALDEATALIVKELDDLSAEVASIKARVVENSTSAKASITGHFVLAAEASIFAATIRTKLSAVMHEAEQVLRTR